MATSEALVHAEGTLTSTANPAAADTVSVGGKTYTFQSTLTDSDGNVLIGADAEATLANLYNAINLSGTAGTDYAASMTLNEKVEATSKSATTVVVKAKVPGSIGNHIPSTEASTALSWGGATLASGSGDIGVWLEELMDQNQINAEVLFELLSLTPAAD